MSSPLSWDEWLSQHEMAYQMMTSALLWAAGDIIAQNIERYIQTKTASSTTQTATTLVTTNVWSYDVLRTLRLAFFASCIWSPCTHYWFILLEQVFPGEGFTVAAKRMLLDQTCYAPLVILSLFIVISALEGKTFSGIVTKTRAGYWRTLLSNWMLWPIAQLILQGVIPLKQRIIVANCINVPWTAYLAYRAAMQPRVQQGQVKIVASSAPRSVADDEEQLELMEVK